MGKRDPTWIWEYQFGPEAILQAVEVVIVTKDGRRHRVRTLEVPPEMTKLIVG